MAPRNNFVRIQIVLTKGHDYPAYLQSRIPQPQGLLRTTQQAQALRFRRHKVMQDVRAARPTYPTTTYHLIYHQTSHHCRFSLKSTIGLLSRSQLPRIPIAIDLYHDLQLAILMKKTRQSEQNVVVLHQYGLIAANTLYLRSLLTRL
jgi:hypothetical protein